MKFVADEGVDLQIVHALRKDGHDVLYIAEIDSGITDKQVLDYANSEERILMTRDKDFGELVYRDRMIHSGIVLNRLFELSTEQKAKLVMSVIKRFEKELSGSFTVIQPGKIRIRKLG